MSVTTTNDRRRRSAWNVAGLLTGALLASAAVSSIVMAQSAVPSPQVTKNLITYNGLISGWLWLTSGGTSAACYSGGVLALI